MCTRNTIKTFTCVFYRVEVVGLTFLALPLDQDWAWGLGLAEDGDMELVHIALLEEADHAWAQVQSNAAAMIATADRQGFYTHAFYVLHRVHLRCAESELEAMRLILKGALGGRKAAPFVRTSDVCCARAGTHQHA